MFSQTIELFASKREFRFVKGTEELRFRPVVFLAPGQQILSVGEAPAGGPLNQGIAIFEDSDVDALPILESLIRYGLRKVVGGFNLRAITLKVTIGRDIRADLKGFAPSIFQVAATQAGAAKVCLELAP